MTFTFPAEDHDFAASTGDNVNSGNGTGTFDCPPTPTRDLGDTYALSFRLNGGTTIKNATDIRSDPLSSNEGANVFKGLDPARGHLQPRAVRMARGHSEPGLYSESLLLGDDMRGVISDAAHDTFEAAFAGRVPPRRWCGNGLA